MKLKFSFLVRAPHLLAYLYFCTFSHLNQVNDLSNGRTLILPVNVNILSVFFLFFSIKKERLDFPYTLQLSLFPGSYYLQKLWQDDIFYYLHDPRFFSINGQDFLFSLILYRLFKFCIIQNIVDAFWNNNAKGKRSILSVTLDLFLQPRTFWLLPFLHSWRSYLVNLNKPSSTYFKCGQESNLMNFMQKISNLPKHKAFKYI